MGYSQKIQSRAFQFRQTLFWDVDPKVIDPDKNARYIIERMLDLGDTPDLNWMFHYYPKKQIQEVVTTSRTLHKKSANFWGLMLDIPLSHIPCLQHASHKKQRQPSKS